MANTPAQWEANKNSIVNAVNNGTATAQQIAWYNKWRGLGAPSSQQAMWDAQNVTTAPAAVQVTAADEQQQAAQQPTEPVGMLQPERDIWYQRYLDRGVIDEQGNILIPNAINTATLVRNTPDWAKGNDALLRNAYLINFEAQARNAGADWSPEGSGDYSGFTDMGFELTPEERQRIGSVAGQDMGHNDSLTFGGGQPTTGVALPAVATETQQPAEFEYTDYQAAKLGNNTPFMDAYLRTRQQPAVSAGVRQAPINAAPTTPFADAYLRARDQQRKQGPVSGLFSKELGGQ